MDNTVETKLELRYIGKDFWECPVYKDQFGRLWKDTELGASPTPSLYSCGYDFDGEPGSPITAPYEILEKAPSQEHQFEYMMLNRLQQDCVTHIDEDSPSSGRIRPENAAGIIQEMKELWKGLPEKPEWLQWEQILDYEARILGKGSQ